MFTKFVNFYFTGCTPKKVWMIVRHGTRNPSTSNIESINSRLPEIKTLILNSENLPNGNLILKDKKNRINMLIYFRVH